MGWTDLLSEIRSASKVEQVDSKQIRLIPCPVEKDESLKPIQEVEEHRRERGRGRST